MPQATQKLRDIWGVSEEKAFAQLEGKINERAGLIQFKEGYVPTPDDMSALTFLLQEWDYDYAL